MAIFINGIIFTAHNNKTVESFCVRNGKFTAVGTNEEIKKIAAPDEEIIDLAGKTVVPGLNDAHMHFLNYAVMKDRVELSSLRSIQDMINVSKDYIKTREISESSWVISMGWNQNLFDEKRLPNRYDLDEISGSNPIFFSRICGHIGVANSKAMEILNINKDTPNPEGGIIDKDPLTGLPTGILRENALNIVSNTLPPMDKDEIKRLLSSTFKDALKVGLTSIQTEDVGQAKSLENLLEAYKELEEEEKLPLRVTLQLSLPDKDSLRRANSLGLKSGVGSTFLKIGPLKLFQDGSLGARTALMQDSYCDVDTKGVSIYSQEALNELTRYADSIGFQIAVHTIGDEAANMVLKSFEGITRRPAIIHCQFTNNELLKRFKKQNVIANVQPSFVMTDWPIVDTAVGEMRSSCSYAWKDMLALNIPVAFSSDAPVESFNPFYSIYAAVTRKNLNRKPDDGWHNEQNLSVSEAVTAFTLGSAYMSFEENFKGSIETGKAADFVVLSQNIFNINPDDIKNTQVLATYVDGKKAYTI